MPDLLPVPLDGVPEGTRALAESRPDGTLPRDRKGRTAVRRVRLAADGTAPATDPGPTAGRLHPRVTEPDWQWLTGAPTRRWDTVAARLGEAAWPRAVELARAAVLTVDCGVEGLRLGAPTAVRLTLPWAELCGRRRDERTTTVDGLRERAGALAARVQYVDGGLGQALRRARGHERTLPVLLAAANDLLEGRTHDGPRAFSQAHFGDTKTREDAPDILTTAGAADTTLLALGLARSPYLGLGGRVVLPGADGRPVRLGSWPGPVRFRVTPALRPTLLPETTTLLLVENLQAAETACDAYGDRAAVVWFAGQPSDQALAVVGALAADAGTVLVAPDADWGGARIAARLLTALPGRAVVLDCGTAPHEPREPFGSASRDGLWALHEHHDPRVADFARAVLDRGYPVEQEANSRAVLADALSDQVAGPRRAPPQ